MCSAVKWQSLNRFYGWADTEPSTPVTNDLHGLSKVLVRHSQPFSSSDVTMDDDDDDEDMFLASARSSSATNGRLQPLLPGKLSGSSPL